MKIIIVGNSPDLLDKKNGKLIDSFDYVLRMNEFVTEGFEDYVGIKCNIYAVAWATPNKKNFKLFDNVIYYTGPDNLKNYKPEHNVDVLSLNDYDYIHQDFKFKNNETQASMGASMIWYFINYFPKFKITITGFDFFGLKYNHRQSGHYYSEIRYPYERFLIHHDPQKEMNYVNKMIKQNKISVL